MATFYADVSTYQAYLDSTYMRPFVMLRVSNENAHLDSNIALNLATALQMRADGRLTNFGGYILPGVKSNAAILATLDLANFPTDAVVMLDVESWGGLVQGNRSASFNSLAESLKARQNGRADLVWGYGNRGDLAALWPSRPAWLGIVVAAYSSNQPSVPGMVGWQYSDGQSKFPVPAGYPRSSAPFGACDHNVLLGPIPAPGAPASDWFDMATKTDLAELFNEFYSKLLYGDGPDVPDSKNTHADNIRRTRKDIGVLAAVLSLITNGDGPDVDVSVDTHGNSLKAIRAAQRVADAKLTAAPATITAAVVAAVPGSNPDVVIAAVREAIAALSITGTITGKVA